MLPPRKSNNVIWGENIGNRKEKEKFERKYKEKIKVKRAKQI
jgi:hypothetical protein